MASTGGMVPLCYPLTRKTSLLVDSIAMKTTLDLPDDLVREMKLRALMQGRTLRDLTADFLRQGLGMSTARPVQAAQCTRVEFGADGLPILRGVVDAPAKLMGNDALLALERDTQNQEDMRRAGLSV